MYVETTVHIRNGDRAMPTPRRNTPTLTYPMGHCTGNAVRLAAHSFICGGRVGVPEFPAPAIRQCMPCVCSGVLSLGLHCFYLFYFIQNGGCLVEIAASFGPRFRSGVLQFEREFSACVYRSDHGQSYCSTRKFEARVYTANLEGMA